MQGLHSTIVQVASYSLMVLAGALRMLHATGHTDEARFM